MLKFVPVSERTEPRHANPRSLLVLITNHALDGYAGTETYVRDLSIRLLGRGHKPVVYSPRLGLIAEEIRKAAVPVIDDLHQLGCEPDIIHGHHHCETLTALLHFPCTPAVFFCHGWVPWQEAPLLFPRIRRYVAVDEASRDRLVLENGIPESSVEVLLNAVDLQRFPVRSGLPEVPRRALVFNNELCETNGLKLIRQACERAGLRLDVIGQSAGRPLREPGKVFQHYEIVFAKGRAALEAAAAGAAVILCGAEGCGPMVTARELDWLRRYQRTLPLELAPEVLCQQIARYNPEDAKRVSLAVRKNANLTTLVTQILRVYSEAMTCHARMGRDDMRMEFRATARYLRRPPGRPAPTADPNRTRGEPALNTLLTIYQRRPDLQQAFPEARGWDLRRLVEWAAGACRGTHDTAREELGPWGEWYAAACGSAINSDTD